MEIVLMGYMASGKTSVGKKLAQLMNLDFIDLDNYIQSQEKKSINELFESEGEIYFRLKESEYLKEILNQKQNYVLSLGGGTPCYANNSLEIIESSAKSFYLKASLQTLYQRLLSEKESRPLIQTISDEELKDFISKHLFERNSYYQQADKIITVDNKTIEEIADEIIQGVG